MSDVIRRFREERERMDQKVLKSNNLGISRFFALDARVYEAGALDARTKELIGLAASMALGCDECIAYHIIRCVEEGSSDEELFEVMNVALVIGGSIVIPHLRKAVVRLDEIRDAEKRERV